MEAPHKTMASCKFVLKPCSNLCYRSLISITALIFISLFSGCSNTPYQEEDVTKPTLYAALLEDPRTLDPTSASDTISSMVIDSIYPSFFQYHYLKRSPLELDLSLGESMPKIVVLPVEFTEKAEDKLGDKITTHAGKTSTGMGEKWTFHIKKGLRFQNDPCFPGGKGREITADDFVFTFKRLADPTAKYSNLETMESLIPGFWQFNIENQKRLEAGKKVDYSLPISGVQRDPNDPYAFSVTIRRKFPQLKYHMARHQTSPLPHEAIEKYGSKFARHPVGCGSFYLEEYLPKSRIVLRANPNRMREIYPSEGAPGDREKGLLADSGRLLPLVERVQFNIMPESITSWNYFLQGYLDVAFVNQSNYEQAMGIGGAGKLTEEMAHKGIEMTHAPNMNIIQYGFNMEDKQVGGYSDKNRKLRQAISLSIDSQAYIDLNALGIGIPAQSMLPPQIPGYDEDYRNEFRQANLEKAKALLAEAGYADGIDPATGKKFVLIWENSNTSPLTRQATALIKKQVEMLGISVDTRSVPFSKLLEDVRKGDFQFCDMHWTADYPDPENFYFMLKGKNKGGENKSRYDNPEFNRLYEQFETKENGSERDQIMRKMRALTAADCPQIYIYHVENLVLTQAWIKNFKPHPISQDVFKYRRVEGALRSKLRVAWNRPVYWPVGIAIGVIALFNLPAIGVIRSRRDRRIRRMKEGT